MELDDFYKIDFLTSQSSLFIFGHNSDRDEGDAEANWYWA